MLKEITTTTSLDAITGSISAHLNNFAAVFNEFMSSAANMRLVSLILMLSAVGLLVILLIFLFIKSLISSSRRNKAGKAKVSTSTEAEEAEQEEELERERDLERELERDLEQASRRQQLQEEQAEKQKRDLEQERRAKELKEQEQKEEKAKKEKEEENIILEREAKKDKDNLLDFDWQKGKTPQAEASAEAIDINNLQYQQVNKPLNELLGLLVDMIGRNVDDLKVAQTLSFRNQNLNSEDDILQTIDAVKDFIALCVNGKFDKLRAEKDLPSEREALYHLALGDNTLALALLEALMDENIDRSSIFTSGPQRDEIFKETSYHASTFGTIAALNDVHLATGAFELSVELAPDNVNSWGRLGDMYAKADSKNKAMQAYQNVLSMADEEIYPRQIANAEKMLSQYYYEQGNNLQAAKLYNSSKSFYDSLGINHRLERQEVEVIEIIEAKQNDELAETVNKLLLRQQPRSYSYA